MTHMTLISLAADHHSMSAGRQIALIAALSVLGGLLGARFGPALSHRLRRARKQRKTRNDKSRW